MKRCGEIKKLTDHPFLNLYHIDAVTKSGKAFDYYFASRNDEEHLKAVTHENREEGIAVYAVREENKGELVMIRQFRYPLNDYIYEIPAGLVDPGENARQAAIREMKEETGLDFEVYEGGLPMYRRPFFMAQGLTDESSAMIYGYAAGEISFGGQEDNEEIEVLFVDREKAKEILESQRVSLRAAWALMSFLHADEDKPFGFLE